MTPVIHPTHSLDSADGNGALAEFGTAVPVSHNGNKEPDTFVTADDERKPHSHLVQWGEMGDKVYAGIGQAHKTLPPGVYVVEINEGRLIFRQQPIHADNLYEFPGSPQDRILREIETFWERGEAYARRGFKHRRGYLLYGPAGSGKTGVVQQTIARVIARGGIVFWCARYPVLLSGGLQQFRLIEPQRPILCVFEDIDALIEKHGESDLLALLDGEAQIDRVLNLATTNYPERLDRRIVGRPRRFDVVVKVDMPDRQMRQMYLERKLDDPALIRQLVDVSDGFSLAALANLVIEIVCLENDRQETIRRMREMARANPHSSDFRGDTGFKSGSSR